MSDKNKPAEQTYYEKPRIIEVWLFNGQVLPVETGTKPRKVEFFGVKWLHLIDGHNTTLDIKLDAVAYIRNYTKEYYDSMLPPERSKKPKGTEEENYD